MDPLDRLCHGLARRRRLERCLRHGIPTLAAALLVAATAVACVRLAVPDGAWLIPVLAAAAVLAPFIRLPALLRQRDPPWLLAALADRLTDSQGLAMALAAQPAAQRDPAWTARLAPALAAAPLPPLRLPALLPLLGAAALLSGACLLPQFSPPSAAPPLLGSAARALEAKLEEIRDQQLAPPEAVQTYAERLAAVRDAISMRGLDQQTWAALDALEGDLAAERARSSARLADALAKAEALGALNADSPADSAAQAAADMAAAIAELQRQAPGLAAKLPAGSERDALLRLAQEAAAGGALTEQQRAALERLGLDPQGSTKPAPGDAAAAKALAQRLAAQLAATAATDTSEDGGGASGMPGPGGGHPELTWGAGSRVAGGYRDRLASGTPLHPEAGAVIGAQARAPRDDELPPPVAGTAALTEQTAVAADRRTAQVAPRHRAARDRYFAAGVVTTPAKPPPAPVPEPTP